MVTATSSCEACLTCVEPGRSHPPLGTTRMTSVVCIYATCTFSSCRPYCCRQYETRHRPHQVHMKVQRSKATPTMMLRQEKSVRETGKNVLRLGTTLAWAWQPLVLIGYNSFVGDCRQWPHERTTCTCRRCSLVKRSSARGCLLPSHTLLGLLNKLQAQEGTNGCSCGMYDRKAQM